ncbi:hypothetical protein GH975_03345 [Litorivicinus lipolyticus]|uniref:DUF403 domain-containing protein n=1 Tax=Litorivicinus lipolyticus TaxID=418701 RepID=A0A5Q2Q930_9GAMM|nr:alpha-E domain-containing protein [Litorivicinus lipolyticus]QGG79653.1 hypothetical protein GH975_03345 [Litorivicinus lipolyticus]
MLARVAEHLYWLGRYIERAEDTSRLFDATINLMLDLPEDAPLNWANLVDAITSEGDDGLAEPTETRVSRWLLLDSKNPASIRSCIKAARENARVARDQIPKDAWEGLNRMDLLLAEGSAVNMSRRKRSELLRQVIWGCRHFSGVLHGSMSRDEAWQFLRLGLQMERADMSSRLLDFKTTSLLPDAEWIQDVDTTLGWMGILQAQDGYEMYRHSVTNRVKPREALKFLLMDRSFPRSLVHALGEVESGLLGLPVKASAPREVRQTRQWVENLPADNMSADDLSEAMDEFQSRLDLVHESIQEAFFARNL